MTNRVTDTNYKNLRSGHTVWRCLVESSGTVYMYEVLLSGSKVTKVLRSMFDDKRVLSSALCIKDKRREFSGEYLTDIRGHNECVQAFTSRRAAKRFIAEVEAGYHPKAIQAAKDHEEFCKSLSGYDDYYDSDYDVHRSDCGSDYDYDLHSENVAQGY